MKKKLDQPIPVWKAAILSGFLLGPLFFMAGFENYSRHGNVGFQGLPLAITGVVFVAVAIGTALYGIITKKE